MSENNTNSKFGPEYLDSSDPFYLHSKKGSGKFTWKNTWIYLNSSGRFISPEPYLNTPEIYLKFTWKIQVSLPELLPELTWNLPEKNTWTVQVIFTVQVILPEFYLNIPRFRPRLMKRL